MNGHSLDEIAYSALDRWEREGQYPDPDEFNAMTLELYRLTNEAARYKMVIDECQHAEHLRRQDHLTSANWRPLKGSLSGPTSDGTTDSSADC